MDTINGIKLAIQNSQNVFRYKRFIIYLSNTFYNNNKIIF